MKANPGKFHILLSNKKTEKVTNKGTDLKCRREITLDSELKFVKYITDICNKGIQKIHVLSRVTYYMSLNKRRLLKTFVEFHFNYHSFIWMFHSKRLDKKINNVHEKALRIIYFHYKSTFQEILDKVASFSVYHTKIQTVVIEIHKHIHGLSPAILKEVFKINRTLPYIIFQQSF